MSLHPHHQELQAEDDLLSAIDQLARNNRTQVVKSRRIKNRVELNCGVSVKPANASDRGTFRIAGRCRDVSPTGGRLVLDRPMAVGDIYLVNFEGEQFRLDPTFVRCMRCHLIREDSFECGVSFLSPVDLEAAIAAPNAASEVLNRSGESGGSASTSVQVPVADPAANVAQVATTASIADTVSAATESILRREEVRTQQVQVQPNV